VLSRDLGLLNNEDYLRSAKELTSVRKMLNSLLNTITKSQLKSKAAVSG
jgi:hypothetical protein